MCVSVHVDGWVSVALMSGPHVHKCPCRWLGLRAPDESNRRHGVLRMWGRNGLGAASRRLWLDMVFAGIRRLPCFATCACGLVRFLLAYVGTRRHATLPTGMWLDLEHIQHRYLGNRPRHRSPITSVVSGTVSPPLSPVALRGQPSLTVGHGSHVHKCPC